MADQIMEGVSPTRMELLEIRKKLTLAEKGHKLLEEKRDALVEKFFNIIDKRNQLSKELDSDFKSAYLSLIGAQMIMGEKKVEQLFGVIEINGKHHQPSTIYNVGVFFVADIQNTLTNLVSAGLLEYRIVGEFSQYET